MSGIAPLLPSFPLLLTKTQQVGVITGAFVGITGTYACLSETEVERAKAYLEKVGNIIENEGDFNVQFAGWLNEPITESEIPGMKQLLNQIELDAARLYQVTERIKNQNRFIS